MQKLFQTRLFIQVAMATLIATLATVGIVAATTTIGSSISSTGTLAVTSTTATSTFSTGGLTVGTNQFVVQQTSGKVGIGTSSPSALLTIQGTATTATLGSELITVTADKDFSGAGDWTNSGGTWSVAGGVITHTAGIDALSLPTLSVVSGNTYQITFDVNTTVAGTLTPSIGGVNGPAYGQSTGALTGQVEVIIATGAGALTFTPSAAWTGTIDNVSVMQVNTTPALVTLQNSDGTTGLEMRSGGANSSFIGIAAGEANTTGYLNTASGYQSLLSNTTGSNNTANGAWALKANTTGSNNTAIGTDSLYVNTTGVFNTANGYISLFSNTTGGRNTANGYASLKNNITGSYNVANGMYSLYTNNGSYNTAIGSSAGMSLTTGSYNIAIGQYVDLPSNTANQQLNIGNVLYGTGIYGGSSVSSVAVATANIGISTTTPYAKLSIQGTNITSATVAIRPVASQTANILDLYTSAGVLNSVIDSSNRWGIGTTTPAATLDVNGYMKLKMNTSQPVACSAINGGSLALNSLYYLCICNGSSWVYATSTQACAW